MSKKSGFSLLEKFSIIFLLLAAIYLIYSFFMPVIDVISGKTFEPRDFILNLTVLLILIAIPRSSAAVGTDRCNNGAS